MVKKVKSLLIRYRLQLAILLTGLAAADIFLVEFVNDLIVVSLVGFWALVVLLFRWPSRTSILLAMVSLLPAALFLVFRAPPIAEKFALWAYIFFITAIIQELLFEIRKKWSRKK